MIGIYNSRNENHVKMRWITHIFAFLIMGLMTQCKTVRTADNIQTGERILEFNRSPCFGYCPVYSVILFQNRELYFIGERFVPIADTLHFRISKKEMSAIQNTMNSSDYQNIRLDPPQDEIMDAPRLLFTDHLHDRILDMDIRIPAPILSITNHIDKILKNNDLLYQEEDLPLQREEVIISLVPHTDPTSITGSWKGFELVFIKNIGNNIHLYEIITPSSYLSHAIDEIKTNDRIQEIQKNHLLDQRNRP